jgi:hypothetical protein
MPSCDARVHRFSERMPAVLYLARTVAPRITALDISRTVPEIDPDSVCRKLAPSKTGRTLQPTNETIDTCPRTHISRQSLVEIRPPVRITQPNGLSTQVCLQSHHVQNHKVNSYQIRKNAKNSVLHICKSEIRCSLYAPNGGRPDSRVLASRILPMEIVGIGK